MLRHCLIGLVLLAAAPLLARDRAVTSQKINEFQVGRLTLSDFGPPFSVYEIYTVRSTATGSSIQRVTLTPSAHTCSQSAKVEVAEGSVDQSVESLLAGESPCSIPERKLRHEMNRCAKCAVFSGSVTSMQLRCGAKTKVLHSFILDKDLFDAVAKTPPYTAWTMRLMRDLDGPLGPSDIDHPNFHPKEKKSSLSSFAWATLQDLSSGKYDALFDGAPEKPSEIYHAAAQALPNPDIQVNINSVAQPQVQVAPIYPPLASRLHLGGTVVLKFWIDAEGEASSILIESGQPMLRDAAEKAISSWKFRPQDATQQVEVSIEFIPDCAARSGT